jgi:hypothetical protein
MKNLADYLDAMLFALLGNRELIARWWASPNLAFEGQCPCDVDENTIKTYLEGHCFG